MARREDKTSPNEAPELNKTRTSRRVDVQATSKYVGETSAKTSIFKAIQALVEKSEEHFHQQFPDLLRRLATLHHILHDKSICIWYGNDKVFIRFRWAHDFTSPNAFEQLPAVVQIYHVTNISIFKEGSDDEKVWVMNRHNVWIEGAGKESQT